MTDFSFSVSGVRSTANIDTSAIFNADYVEPTSSPIALFFDSLSMGIRILGAPPDPMTEDYRYLAGLVVLGCVSSVETYFRRVIRRTILLDKTAERKSHDKPLSYGAALHHDTILLPEALLEDVNFSSSRGIKDSFTNFLDVNIAQPAKIKKALENFEIVCNLRHCLVHRSGKLGSKNAIRFGLDEHRTFLEKPIVVGFNSVQDICQVCSVLVQEVNDFLFVELLKRSAAYMDWSNDLRKDKPKLKRYFEVFSREPVNDAMLRECHKKLMGFLQ